MNRLTAMEIVGNPRDLHFIVAEAKKPGPNGSWYIAVNRGPGHNYKPLLSTDKPEQLRPSREDALYVVEMGVLYMALAGEQIPAGAESMQRVNDAQGRDAKRIAMREAIEQSKPSPDGCLTLSMVDQIMVELTAKGECMTGDLLVAIA